MSSRYKTSKSMARSHPLKSSESSILRGTIIHIKNGNITDYLHYIKRTLYIGNVPYTISDGKIMMNSLQNMSQVNELSILE